jgi:hypothetical protein
LIKALDAAANARLRVRLIGIANKVQDKLSEPAEVIRQYGIVHVPTVIVERDGREIGRIVENPVAKNMEEDLSAILTGKPNSRNAP